MPNQDYTNIESIRPQYGQMNVPGLAGMWAAQDRQRYEQQAGLQDLMKQGQYQDYLADAPVRASGRLKDIATNQATANTIIPQKQAELDKVQMENKFTKGTMDSRMGATIAENALKEQQAGLSKIRNGLALSTMMMQSMERAGPAGAAAAIEGLKSRGIDVENDPVVKHVLSAGSREEMQARMQQIYYAFNKASEQFNIAQQQGSTAMGVQDLRNQGGAREAEIRGASSNKEHEGAVAAYSERIREMNPGWSKAQVAQAAWDMYMKNRYSAYMAPQMPAIREGEEALAKAEGLLAILPKNSPMRPQLEQYVNKLKQERQQPNRPSGAVITLPDGSIDLDALERGNR